MKTLTFNNSNAASKNLIKGVLTALLLSTVSLAQAGTALVTVTDSYLYESLIQAEFEIDNQTQASVDKTSAETFQQVLMTSNPFTTVNEESTLTARAIAESARLENVQTIGE